MEIKDLDTAVESWKRGESIWSAELGVIGPAYEQCIQLLLWEILARWKGGDLSHEQNAKSYPDEYSKHADLVTSELDAIHRFSGAQVGAAKRTAFQFLAYGYKEMMDRLEKDRHILVCREFPNLPTPQANE